MPGALALSFARIRDALHAGLNTEALDLAREAIFESPEAAEPRYVAALASIRMGAITQAERWLAPIDRDRVGSRELAADIWSLSGRIAKERYAGVEAAACKPCHALTSIASYRRAFEISSAAYPAVNAATMAMLAGDELLARDLARQALSALAGDPDHWYHATAGEAKLLLGEIDAARRHYVEAHRLAGTRFGDIASMRRQLLLIGTDAARSLLDAIPAPRIVAFSGHMIDHPSRATPRFPAALEPKVASAICEKLASLGPSIGYAQAACGGDILFLEAMQAAGMQTNIVLPCAQGDFVEASVSFAGDEWRARFERVLRGATRVVLATEEAYLGDEVLFEHAANLIQGMAFLRARELSTQPLLLTVSEPQSAERTGGTAATAREWRSKGGAVENIDLAALRGENYAPRVSEHDQVAPAIGARAATPRSLKSLVFADIRGFSKLAERHTPEFASMFLHTCKLVLDSLDDSAVDANTRGDALFIVFERPHHAAEFAVRLLTALNALDWPAFGLPADTSVRVGLHAGPVYVVFDPVMSKTTFYGTHVNLAARLEPVVQPGHIFATEAFAASLVAEGEGRFQCDYIGAMPLAKRFGQARLYRVHT